LFKYVLLEIEEKYKQLGKSSKALSMAQGCNLGLRNAHDPVHGKQVVCL